PPTGTLPASNRTASNRPASTASRLARAFGRRRRSSPRNTVTKAITIALALFIPASLCLFHHQLDTHDPTTIFLCIARLSGAVHPFPPQPSITSTFARGITAREP